MEGLFTQNPDKKKHLPEAGVSSIIIEI